MNQWKLTDLTVMKNILTDSDLESSLTRKFNSRCHKTLTFVKKVDADFGLPVLAPHWLLF